jgi:methionine-rich copper-binding protein CopC/putative copper export protein
MLLFKPPAVHASAYVIGSDPVDGSTIAHVPKEVHIYFNAAISTLSRAHVLVVQQNTLVEIDTNTSIVSGSNPNELIIPLGQAQQLPQGSYLVRWTAVAYDDGRTTFGSIGFNVGVSSTGLSGTSILGPSTSNALDDRRVLDIGHVTNLLVVLWEWIMLASLTLWIGILVMEQFVLSDRGHCAELCTHIHKRVYSLQWLCLAALLFSEIVLLILRTTDIVENTQTNNAYLAIIQNLLTNTNYGHFWMACIALILIAMGLLYRTNQIETSMSSEIIAEKRHPLVWSLLTSLILLTLVLTRAPAQTFQPHMSAIVFDWLNLAALGIWFGSFVYLGYLIIPFFNSKELEHYTETLTTVLRHLIPFMLAAISVEAISTLFLSESAISQPQQLLHDPYGCTLLIQLVILALMLILTLSWVGTSYNSYRTSRSPYGENKILAAPMPSLGLGQATTPLHTNLLAPRLRQSAWQQIRKSLHFTSTIITWLGGGMLLCMALMTFFTPPIHFPDVTYSSQAVNLASTTNAQTKQIDDLSVSLQLLPGRSNQANTVVLLINDSNGKPVTNAQVHLTTNMQAMDMGIGSAAMNGGNPVYITTFAKNASFNMVGVWIINVEIQRPKHNTGQGTFQVTLS